MHTYIDIHTRRQQTLTDRTASRGVFFLMGLRVGHVIIGWTGGTSASTAGKQNMHATVALVLHGIAASLACAWNRVDAGHAVPARLRHGPGLPPGVLDAS